MAALTLGIPEHQMRVVAPAVGGGFGSKLNVYAEELLCVGPGHASIGVPVRWTEERTENAQATIQGRGQIQDIELAADADGKLTAHPGQPDRRHGRLPAAGHARHPAARRLPLRRRLRPAPAYSFSCTGVFTTMTPTDAYRGAGRPEATYAIERAMDAPGRRDRASTRSSCAAATSSRPSSSPTPPSAGLVYDSGDHDAALDKALEHGRLRRAPQPSSRRRTCARRAPSTSASASRRYFEMCGLAPSRVLASLNYAAGGWEAATVRVLPTNKVQVVTGTDAPRPGPRDRRGR